jgi:hypothetical protein
MLEWLNPEQLKPVPIPLCSSSLCQYPCVPQACAVANALRVVELYGCMANSLLRHNALQVVGLYGKLTPEVAQNFRGLGACKQLNL